MNGADTGQNLNTITSGRYRDAYVIYTRRSTDDPDSQKNSIGYQRALGVRHCRAEGLPIAAVTLSGFCTDGVISERHSAFKESVEMEFGDNGTVRYRVERPKFHRLATFLAQKHFKGVVFLCWDRASRNKGDELVLRKLMKAKVDVRFVLASYDNTSAGELHKDIDGMFAEHHSRVTREKVTLTMRESRSKGWCTHRARVGYLNTGSMRFKPLDPERAPLIRRLYEQADRTNWSLADLQRWIVSQGFTMPPMRRRRTADEILEDEERDEHRELEKVTRLPTVKNIHQILTSPFYTGKIPGNDGSWVPSTSHEALVSEALFERVQVKLGRRRTSVHYDAKLSLPFRGLVRCGCGRVYTPYEQKGHVYLGARCDRSCSNPRKNVKLEDAAQAVRRILDNLVLTEDELAQIEAATADTALQTRDDARAQEVRDRRARKLREDLAYLADNRLTLLRTGAYTPEALTEDEVRFTNELAQLERPLAVSGDELREMAGRMIGVSELLKTAQLRHALAKPSELEPLARLTLSELTLSENTLDYQCVSELHHLKRRFMFEGDLTAWLSECAKHPNAIGAATVALKGFIKGVERP